MIDGGRDPTALPVHLRHLSLRAFRNYASLDLDLDRGLTLVIGPNGQGKTNLIEAVYFLCLGRSFREHRESRLIHFGDPAARVRGLFERDGSRRTLQVVLPRSGKKQAAIDDSPLDRLSELIGEVPVVSLTPEDVAIAYGGPGPRRRFLDMLLAQTDRGYLEALKRYRRTLAQRNRCLREGREHLATTYEVELSLSGTRLQRQRRKLVSWLADETAATYAQLSGGEEKLGVRLQSSPAVDTGFAGSDKDPGASQEGESGPLAEALARSRSADLERGFTSVGPHRDELALSVEERPLRHYGSHGQARTALAALKLAEVAYYARAYDRQPVLLMDEVTSVLDRQRAGQLVELLAGHTSQVLVTAPEAGELGPLAEQADRRLKVGAGEVHEA